MRKTKLTTSAIFGADSHSAQLHDDLFSKESRQALHECFWADAEDGLKLPLALRPAQGDAESLFAEVATYFPSYTPITAYMRVLEKDFFPEPQRKFREISPYLSELELKSAVGLAIGEILTASARTARSSIENVSYGAARRTLAFTVFRTAALHGSLESDAVVERWLRIREIMGLDSLTEQAATISWIRSIQREKSPTPPEEGLRSYISEIICGRQSSRWLSSQLAEALGGIHKEVEALRGPFDDRIAAFRILVDAVAARFPSGEFGAVCIAFFCNEILPGSLTHHKLLNPFISLYPTALVWYSLFASLSEKFELRDSFSGLGLKMARDLLQPFSMGSRPTCDIAFSELEVLSRLPLKAEVIKPAQARACSIEILPGVETVFRIGNEEESRTQTQEVRQLMDDQARRNDYLRNLLLDALDMVSDRKTPTPYPSTNRSKRSRS